MTTPYILQNHGRAASPRRRRGRGLVALAAALILLAGAAALAMRSRVGPPPRSPDLTTPPDAPLQTNGVRQTPQVIPVAPPPSAFRHVVFPTDQADLLQPDKPGVVQPTAAGKPESALYGSVRMVNRGRHLMTSFHEGVDIAPTQRDRRGHPLDAAHAIADGRVAHINRIPGNSNYGNYVVLLHADPLGEVYTLYAHLAAIAPGLAAGQPVQAGTVLGAMGNTPVNIIPVDRSHLHFEIGMVNNMRFDAWFHAQKLKPDHGNFNGWNLLAVDPLAFFRAQRQAKEFEFRSYLQEVPKAFEILVPCRGQIDYFRRYAALWQSPPFLGGEMVIACSENGVPLAGRQARDGEAPPRGKARAVVLSVDEKGLGRNGCHLITRDSRGWRLTVNGERWLQILTY
jgi:peptidoglycan LD-endopeptidase LytH